MEKELVTTGAIDPAAMAFDTLRLEVTTLRLAVQQLAAAPTTIDIPDYTETLAEIRGATQALASHYRKLREAPALMVTPDLLAAQINAASAEARKAERQSLQSAENSFVAITRELTGFVESARTADRQNKWILGISARDCNVRGVCYDDDALGQRGTACNHRSAAKRAKTAVKRVLVRVQVTRKTLANLLKSLENVGREGAILSPRPFSCAGPLSSHDVFSDTFCQWLDLLALCSSARLMRSQMADAE